MSPVSPSPVPLRPVPQSPVPAGRGRGVRLTGRGGGLLVTALVMVAGGVVFGIEELYALAAAALVLLVASALWVRSYGWDLRTARNVTPSRVPAGADVVVELAVRNRAERRAPLIVVRDPFDGGRSSVSLTVAPLDAGVTERTAYRVPAAERGTYQIGPLELELADPFGLLVSTRPGVEASPLIVHPRIVELGPPPQRGGADPAAADAWTTSRSVGGELASVREYRTGDDLRRVHWPSTARLDELMVRQDENPLESRLTVAVDLRDEVWSAGGLETALSAAASVVVGSIGRRVETRLVTSGGLTTGFATGAAHQAGLLDVLAAADTDEGRTVGAHLRAACAAGPALLVTAANRAGLDLLGAVSSQGGATTCVLVLAERGASLATQALPEGGAVDLAGTYVVDSVEALAGLWRGGRDGR